MKKILVCGGHLTPAIALVETLSAKKDVKVFLFTKINTTEGSKGISAEFKEAQKYNVKIINLISGRIQRKFTKHTIPALLKIPLSFVQSLFYLIKIRPHVVIAVGGSLSLPVIFNAWLLGIPSVIHEQAVEPGISNKINALFTDAIFVTWPQTLKFFPKQKTQLVGNLIRPSTQSVSKNKKLLNFVSTKKNLILVAGGNQGSHFLNNLVFENIKDFTSYKMVHVLGTANFKNDHEKAFNFKNPNYLAFDYLTAADIAHIYSRAKVVISRSGANTIWDLASFSNVSILIPLPIAAGNEQFKNALILKTAGSAVILEQRACNKKTLNDALKELEANYHQLKKNADLFRKSLVLKGNEKVSNYLLSLA